MLSSERANEFHYILEDSTEANFGFTLGIFYGMPIFEKELQNLGYPWFQTQQIHVGTNLLSPKKEDLSVLSEHANQIHQGYQQFSSGQQIYLQENPQNSEYVGPNLDISNLNRSSLNSEKNSFCLREDSLNEGNAKVDWRQMDKVIKTLQDRAAKLELELERMRPTDYDLGAEKSDCEELQSSAYDTHDAFILRERKRLAYKPQYPL